MLCEKKGIILIEVWDKTFLKNPQKVESELYQFITGGV